MKLNKNELELEATGQACEDGSVISKNCYCTIFTRQRGFEIASSSQKSQCDCQNTSQDIVTITAYRYGDMVLFEGNVTLDALIGPGLKRYFPAISKLRLNLTFSSKCGSVYNFKLRGDEPWDVSTFSRIDCSSPSVYLSPGHGKHTDLVVGIVVGGLVLVAVIVIIICVSKRLRRKPTSGRMDEGSKKQQMEENQYDSLTSINYYERLSMTNQVQTEDGYDDLTTPGNKTSSPMEKDGPYYTEILPDSPDVVKDEAHPAIQHGCDASTDL